MAPQWRHPYYSPYPSAMTPMDRINLRLSAQVFQVIDEARSKRPGNVSRNTWIAEAIEEKLARELSLATEPIERVVNA